MTTRDPARAEPVAVASPPIAAASVCNVPAPIVTLFAILFFAGVIVLAALAFPAVCVAVIALVEWLS